MSKLILFLIIFSSCSATQPSICGDLLAARRRASYHYNAEEIAQIDSLILKCKCCNE